jgi:AmmeMemoRadiSam system protein B
MLRDTEGVTPKVATIPAPLIPIVARFGGSLTVVEIAELVSKEVGSEILSVVQRLADELDDLYRQPRYRAGQARRGRSRAARAGRDARGRGVRRSGEAPRLPRARLYRRRRLKKERCRSQAPARRTSTRGAQGQLRPRVRHASRRVSRSRHFVLLGTSHAPREPFALSKAFDTPFGAIDEDRDAIDAIASRSPFDVYADVFNHKREHSLEFQAVFVKYLVGRRKVRIIPILCGIGESQRTGQCPEDDPRSEQFLDAVRAVVDRDADRTVVIAGADLAHVGPRFGDPAPYDEGERGELERTDRASLELASAGAHREFFRQVQSDLDTRRVCGLGPIYALLRLLPSGCQGSLAHYEQTIDPQEGSIVSHAAMAFYA